MSARDFSAQEGIQRHSLYQWKKRFDRGKKTSPPALVPVRVGSTAPPFEVIVDEKQVTVRVPADFDEKALTRLMNVLEGER